MTQTEAPTVDNGVNIEALRGARQALTDAPRRALPVACPLRVGERTHSRSTITDFSGLGDSTPTGRPTHRADHPKCSHRRTTVRPSEIVLGALASCLTAGVATVAQPGVQLRS